MKFAVTYFQANQIGPVRDISHNLVVHGQSTTCWMVVVVEVMVLSRVAVEVCSHPSRPPPPTLSLPPHLTRHTHTWPTQKRAVTIVTRNHPHEPQLGGHSVLSGWRFHGYECRGFCQCSTLPGVDKPLYCARVES